MLANAMRAADIIDRVRSLYMRGTSKWEPFDLNEVIRELTVLLSDTAKRNAVSIRTELGVTFRGLREIGCSFSRVLMNLMLNGIEAMKDTGGELTVSPKKIEDDQLLISVSDTGVGIPSDETGRVFEAFFTTKPQGTGLGLCISRRIIEAHGGRLWANPNSGTGRDLSIHPAERGSVVLAVRQLIANDRAGRRIRPHPEPRATDLFGLGEWFI